MCLYIRNRHCTREGLKRPYKTSKDKVVYKAVIYEGNDRYITPFMGMQLNFQGEDNAATQYADKFEIRGYLYSGYRIENGIHAFTSEKNARDYMAYMRLGLSEDAAEEHEKATRICKAVIPEGTPYYYGQGGDIVATKMIVYKPAE